ncbi:unnamed protein product [Ceratitis capitata]|uniref:(Mediterranean fruit fly) hypothetical protein n=1 Tax=Ceratitis capitata TaxID=7213 RepID=A0A811UTE8_CERCA|nr:unnamed protein product [Ceratitis capitata]
MGTFNFRNGETFGIYHTSPSSTPLSRRRLESLLMPLPVRLNSVLLKGPDQACCDFARVELEYQPIYVVSFSERKSSVAKNNSLFQDVTRHS